MLHTMFQDHQLFGLGEEIFKGFYHVQAWRPFRSCDLTRFDKFGSPCLMKALVN